MENTSKSGRRKSKTKKQAPKPKTVKKRKSDGPTCSMFLAEITRKLAHKTKQEENSPKNVVQSIIESLTNALPVVLSRRTPEKKESPMKIEKLQAFAPELISKDTLNIPAPDLPTAQNIIIEESKSKDLSKQGFRMPKMPLVSSDMMKSSNEKKKTPIKMQDIAVNTGGDHDVASEIAKHVGTLRKISLIAEEFNQKTARNLKEIVESVQEDLIKKLEEIEAERKAARAAAAERQQLIEEIEMNVQ